MDKRQDFIDAYFDTVTSFTELYKSLSLYMIDRYIGRYYRIYDYDFERKPPWEMVELNKDGSVKKVHVPLPWPHLGE